MKKIMFNDKFGLTKAVLEGRKTMTRRVVDFEKVRMSNYDHCAYYDYWHKRFVNNKPTISWDEWIIKHFSRYQFGDVVAIAQPYGTLKIVAPTKEEILNGVITPHFFSMSEPAWTNKMFVKAELMPNHIRITNIKIERLQDISDDDCLKEGVYYCSEPPEFSEYDHYCPWPPSVKPYRWGTDNFKFFCKPQYAFAHLIDKVSKKGTWESNPWVFAYTFKLED